MPESQPMILSSDSFDLSTVLRQRRQRLANRIEVPVLLWSGERSPRNFPANSFPFRASSHFLYFAGLPLENAVIRLEAGRLQLFMDDAPPAHALWHGEMPTRDAIAQDIGADAAYPLADLPAYSQDAATLPVQHPRTQLHQNQILNRFPSPPLQDPDLALAQAIVALRLTHDGAAIAEIRRSAAVSIAAHRAGMAATATANRESEVRAAIEAVMIAQGMTCAYSSIVTVHGEVLHNEQSHHPLHPGDLLLVDAGAETATGWASDITRTWAVSGTFSPTQRSVYEVVLAAHDACIHEVRPGVEYRDIHRKAASVITEGLVEIGILNGNAEDLVEQDAHTLFFPHGVGHLLGLDVHDMEDLGDLAGYEPGRCRSDRFGWSYLRLDRPLRAGMVITIEPGFYQVSGLLQDPIRRSRYAKIVNWERLEQFADVRGIRIEDDVWVTESGYEILTADLPTSIEAIEHLVQNN